MWTRLGTLWLCNVVQMEIIVMVSFQHLVLVSLDLEWQVYDWGQEVGPSAESDWGCLPRFSRTRRITNKSFFFWSVLIVLCTLLYQCSLVTYSFYFNKKVINFSYLMWPCYIVFGTWFCNSENDNLNREEEEEEEAARDNILGLAFAKWFVIERRPWAHFYPFIYIYIYIYLNWRERERVKLLCSRCLIGMDFLKSCF